MTPTGRFPGNALFYLLTIAAFALFGYTVYSRARVVAKGRPDHRLDKPLGRVLGLIPWVAGNLRVARPRYWYSGLLHTLILWGFLVLQVRTANFLLEGVSERISLQSLGGKLYRALMPIMDIFNVLVLVGVAMAWVRRLFFAPRRLTVGRDGYIILGFTGMLMISDISGYGQQDRLRAP